MDDEWVGGMGGWDGWMDEWDVEYNNSCVI